MSDRIDLSELPSRRFQPCIYGVGAWTPHLYFGYDVVALLRPKVIVELGVDRGESYFAFCQAASENSIGARCFAIDTWRGDPHAGNYDETTFAQVTAENARYAEFSTLLRMTFDDALARFADESIDLLHLDGLHTENAVRHDLKKWLPKLSRGGILLLHDICVRVRDFGVWKIWDELRRSGRSWAFEIGPGLGAWQKPPSIPLAPPLESLFSAPNESATALEVYYRERAAELDARIAQHWRDGTIRDTAFAQQTIIQVFYTNDGTHREEESVYARIGHGNWRDLTIKIPAQQSGGPLRIDFVSAFTTIEISEIELRDPCSTSLLDMKSPDAWANIDVRGDAERRAYDSALRIKITGIDPQLHLPVAQQSDFAGELSLHLKLRVLADA